MNNLDEKKTQLIERLTLNLARAKSLTEIGATSDLQDYNDTTLNGYFDALLFLLEQANLECDQLAKIL